MAKNKFLNKTPRVEFQESSKEENILITYIDIDNLEDNIYQPRLNYDEEKLQELANSIQKDGQQVPIKVTDSFDNTGKLMIVFGHRRVRACKLLGLTKIKAFVDDVSKQQLRRLSLIENIIRDDLSVIEIAVSLQNAIFDGTYSTQKELAKDTGYSAAKVSGLFNILNLDARVIKDLEEDRTVSDINSLVLLNKLDNKQQQYEYYKDLRDGKIDRKYLMKLVNSENFFKTNSQCELNLNKTKTSFIFKPSKELTSKGKYIEYETFAKEKLENLQHELEDKEKELLS